MARKTLLSFGVFATMLYIGMNVFIPMLFPGYDSASQTVSELSAVNAPTRPLWVFLALIYILLFAAFGLGVWQSAGENRHLRKMAILIFVYSVVNLYWPPMHLRGYERSTSDTLHIVWAMITLLLMMVMMGVGASALGKTFRLYTILTFIVFLAFGILISVEAPGIAKNLPTPRIGIWERINIGAFMLWVLVLATLLLQREKSIYGEQKEQEMAR